MHIKKKSLKYSKSISAVNCYENQQTRQGELLYNIQGKVHLRRYSWGSGGKIRRAEIPISANSKKAEYFKDWLKNKISNQELAWHVKSKLLDQIRELEEEIQKLKFNDNDRAEYKKILEVMQKHGLNTWYNPAEKLDEALSRPYPRKLDDAFEQLEAALRTINEVRAQARTKASEG